MLCLYGEPQGRAYAMMPNHSPVLCALALALGLEGVMGLRDAEGTLHLLGLCEGNHCLQRNEGGMEKGNGIIVIMRKMRDEARIQPTNTRGSLGRHTPLLVAVL